MHESSVASDWIAVGLCLFLDWENPLFYQQCIMCDTKKLETDCYNLKVDCNCSRCQRPNDPFPFKIFLSPLCHLCSLWHVSMCESKFSSIICVFLNGMWDGVSPYKCSFSSSVSSVGNVSIRAIIFMQRLGCLNIEKWVYNFKCI